MKVSLGNNGQTVTKNAVKRGEVIGVSKPVAQENKSPAATGSKPSNNN